MKRLQSVSCGTMRRALLAISLFYLRLVDCRRNCNTLWLQRLLLHHSLCRTIRLTNVIVPRSCKALQARPLLWSGNTEGGALTLLGSLINTITPIDPKSGGALVNLG